MKSTNHFKIFTIGYFANFELNLINHEENKKKRRRKKRHFSHIDCCYGRFNIIIRTPKKVRANIIFSNKEINWQEIMFSA